MPEKSFWKLQITAVVAVTITVIAADFHVHCRAAALLHDNHRGPLIGIHRAPTWKTAGIMVVAVTITVICNSKMDQSGKVYA